jgi:hypothetical protein
MTVAATPSAGATAIGTLITGLETDAATQAVNLVNTASQDLPAIATASKPLVAAAQMLAAPALSDAIEAGEVGIEEIFVAINSWLKSL